MFIPFLNELKSVRLKVGLFILSTYLIYRSRSDSLLALTLAYFFLLFIQDLSGRISRHFRRSLICTVLILSLGFISVCFLNKGIIPEKVVGFFSIQSELLKSKIVGYEFDQNLAHEAIRERIFYISATMDEIILSRFIGIGAGNFQLANVFFEDRILSFKTLHFYWLEILLVTGIFGLYAYMVWLFRMFKHFLRPENMLFLHSLGLFLIGSVVLSSAVYFLPMYFLYGVGLAKLVENREPLINENITEAHYPSDLETAITKTF
jgi:hypothetical protein